VLARWLCCWPAALGLRQPLPRWATSGPWALSRPAPLARVPRVRSERRRPWLGWLPPPPPAARSAGALQPAPPGSEHRLCVTGHGQAPRAACRASRVLLARTPHWMLTNEPRRTRWVEK